MREFIRLPQLKIFSDREPPSKKILLVSGGRAPSIEWLSECAASIENVWSIDHGLDVCARAKLVPKLLIGDLDSARSESIDWARSMKVPIERHPVDKDLTDTQLALERAIDPKKISSETFFPIEESPIRSEKVLIVMTGAFGGRLDHLFSTIFSCAHSSVPIILADERELVCFVRSGESIRLSIDRKPDALSLLPMSERCLGVSIDGVHWKLERASLAQSFPNAISNRVEADSVDVSIEAGIVAIHMFFDR